MNMHRQVLQLLARCRCWVRAYDQFRENPEQDIYWEYMRQEAALRNFIRDLERKLNQSATQTDPFLP